VTVTVIVVVLATSSLFFYGWVCGDSLHVLLCFGGVVIFVVVGWVSVVVLAGCVVRRCGSWY